jgi:hypothetical protein
LLQIRRSQTIVIAWLIGLAPAGCLVTLLSESDDLFAPLTIFWIAVGLFLAQRVTTNPCPRCGQRFCAKSDLPYWFGLFQRRCDQCGLSLNRRNEIE